MAEDLAVRQAPSVDLTAARAWRDRLTSRWRPKRTAVALTVLFTLVDLAWISRDRTAPSWDQSHYLDMAWQYQYDLLHHGFHAMWHDLETIDPGRGPMLSVLLMPFVWFINEGPESGLVLNLLLWPVLLLSASGIAANYFGDRARWMAVVLLGPTPLLVSLSHQVLQDFPLPTFSTLAIYLMIRTRHFSRPWASVGLGAVLAVASLTKISFLVAVIVPLGITVLIAAYGAWSTRADEGLWHALRRPLGCVGLTVLVGVAFPAAWFATNWSATREYLATAFKQQPGILPDPLTWTQFRALALDTIQEALSWQTFFLGVVIAVAAGVTWARTRRKPNWSNLEPVLVLGSWLVLPYMAVAVSTNHDLRYLVSFIPAVAVVLAGWWAGIRPPRLRQGIAAVVVVVAATQVLQVSSSRWRIPGAPRVVTFSTPLGPAEMSFARGLGGAGLFVPTNYTTTVLDYLESISRNPDGSFQPRRIALLELHGLLNGNNLTYYAAVRHLPFTFDTLFADRTPAALVQELKPYDYAFYLPQQPESQIQGRVEELNFQAAARIMTPAAFSLFEPNPHRIYVGPDASQGDYVYILVRRKS